ncbi:MAG TPA: hypothetical protein DCF68_13810 [Cyanothece sp. UBA12306]|nr:hypothetical protein [Cyanothece sp. UBA12306]
MKLKVTEEGVLIPKELLGDSQEVEVIQEAEKIIITTTQVNLIEPISDFDTLLDKTQGIWTKGNSLDYQQKIREEWS